MATIHATCIVVGEAGVLIRGRSGSGKSTLARLLLEGAAVRGRFARLVCDDRVLLQRRHGRLIARSVAAIAGRMEARGLGLIDVAHEPAAVVRLVADCLHSHPARSPEGEAQRTSVEELALPLISGRVTTDLVWLILNRLESKSPGNGAGS